MNSKTALKSFEKLFKCWVSFHDYDGCLRIKCGLGSCINHKSPFCEYVKNMSSRNLKSCILCDAVMIKERINLKVSPFFKVCHAGVLEICVPILLRSKLSGMLFAGPFYAENFKTFPSGMIFRPVDVYENEKIENLAALKLRKVSPYDAQTVLHFAVMLAAYIEKTLNMNEDSLKVISTAERIEMFFDEKFADKNSNLEMLASFMGLSCSRISQLLRELFKKSFAALLNERRIDHARYMLNETFLGTVSISASCGYSDPAYFFRVFKTMNNGMTPSKYRKENRQGNTGDI